MSARNLPSYTSGRRTSRGRISSGRAGAYLARANLNDAKLIGADLSGAILSGSMLIRADLSGAQLPKATLWGANLIWAKLPGAITSRPVCSSKGVNATVPGQQRRGLPVSRPRVCLAGRNRPGPAQSASLFSPHQRAATCQLPAG
jgi:uncharacterized protein YjbI with pentapeptide repeats